MGPRDYGLRSPETNTLKPQAKTVGAYSLSLRASICPVGGFHKTKFQEIHSFMVSLGFLGGVGVLGLMALDRSGFEVPG